MTRYGRKVGVSVLGGGVLAAGVAMLALPGPGIAVSLVGLSILSLEFTWARRARERLRMRARAAVARARTAQGRRRAGPRVDRKPLVGAGRRPAGSQGPRR